MTEFEKYFNRFDDVLRSLPDDREAFSNGMSIKDASWDRKAAYLIWKGRTQVSPSGTVTTDALVQSLEANRRARNVR